MSGFGVKIDKDIPIPAKKNGKYPWTDMDVGDSFHSDRSYGSMQSSVISAGLRYDRKFVVRKNEDGTGCRVWRVK